MFLAHLGVWGSVKRDSKMAVVGRRENVGLAEAVEVKRWDDCYAIRAAGR